MTASAPSNNNSPSDFPHFDPAVSIALPNVEVSSSDLFGGDLFGDELIDMYSSSSSVSGSSNGEELFSATPSVSSNDADKINSTAAVITSGVLSSDVPVVASNTSPEDDGLGAFRPNTSFNDLHALEAATPSATSSPDTTVDVIPASPIAETCSQTLDPSRQQICAPILGTKRGIQAVSGEEQTTDVCDKAKVPKLKMRNRRKKASGAVVPAYMLPRGKGVQLNQINMRPVSVSPTLFPTQHENASCTPNPLELRTVIFDNNNDSSSVTQSVSLRRIPDSKQSNQKYHGSSNQDGVIAPDQVTSNNSNAAMTTSNLALSNTQASATATAAAVAAATSATVATSTPTVADFTIVAEAAVSNLILSAGVSAAHEAAAAMVTSPNTSKNNVPKYNPNNDVDSTSIAHDNTLTSVNWVTSMNHNTNTATNIPISKTTASSNATAKINHENHVASTNDAAAAAAASAAAAAANVANNKQRCNNRGSRQNLTPDERAKQNRDRNREHARNTRLRKKAYVEELKRTLTEIVAERDATELQHQQDQQRELEQREVRFQVMQEFLLMRGLNEGQKERWEAIMEDGFELTLPVTSMYRKMENNHNLALPSSKECGGGISINSRKPTDSTCSVFSLQENVLHGAEEVMKDSASLAHCLEQTYGGKKVYLSYHCDRNKFLMDGCVGYMDWMASTESSTPNQATFTKLHFKGTMKATFCPASNKIIEATLFFDTGAIFQQLQSLTTALPTYMINTVVGNTREISYKVEETVVDSAAEADAILETLQMPFFPGSTSATISVERDSGVASVTSSERSDSESEDDNLVDMILS